MKIKDAVKILWPIHDNPKALRAVLKFIKQVKKERK
jgi:hypothetical protein